MNESPENTNPEVPVDDAVENADTRAAEHAERMGRKVALARELAESGDVFPFPGIIPEAYAKMRSEDEEYPDLVRPIDDVMKKCNDHGIKVAFGNDPRNNSPLIIPAQLGWAYPDGILPKHLQLEGITDERLIELITLDRSKA